MLFYRAVRAAAVTSGPVLTRSLRAARRAIRTISVGALLETLERTHHRCREVILRAVQWSDFVTVRPQCDHLSAIIHTLLVQIDFEMVWRERNYIDERLRKSVSFLRSCAPPIILNHTTSDQGKQPRSIG